MNRKESKKQQEIRAVLDPRDKEICEWVEQGYTASWIVRTMNLRNLDTGKYLTRQRISQIYLASKRKRSLFMRFIKWLGGEK